MQKNRVMLVADDIDVNRASFLQQCLKRNMRCWKPGTEMRH